MEVKNKNLRWANIGLTLAALLVSLIASKEVLLMLVEEFGSGADTLAILGISIGGAMIGSAISILIQYNLFKVIIELFGLEVNYQWLYLLYLVASIIRSLGELLIPTAWYMTYDWLSLLINLVFTTIFLALIAWYLQREDQTSLMAYKGAILALYALNSLLPLWNWYQLSKF